MKACILYLATSRGPIALHRTDGGWHAHDSLELNATADGDNIHASIACDPMRPERVFFGLPESGIWRSDDAGQSWRSVFRGLPHPRVTALAVAPSAAGGGAVFAGTEPAALFASEDDGETIRRCDALESLPSAKTWSFPPRPESNHIRWIQVRPGMPDHLLVAIEAGALVASPDGGRTWHDRVPGSPIDTHQLAIHPSEPDLLWSAAGDGIFGSIDGGETWRHVEEGLPFDYGWSIAIDAGDPTVRILSAAPDAQCAHFSKTARSSIFRQTDGSEWTEVLAGLPPRNGRQVAVVAATPHENHVFHAAIKGAVFVSQDAGLSWQELPLDWNTITGGTRIHALATA
jgi:photosystem II stability/assembly factor-like uncharacterized protein